MEQCLAKVKDVLALAEDSASEHIASLTEKLKVLPLLMS